MKAKRLRIGAVGAGFLCLLMLVLMQAPAQAAVTMPWHTFMGTQWYMDYGYGVALDGSGSVYVTGVSGNTWGSPINAFAGSPGYSDAFVAKFADNGTLLWSTFMGYANHDYGYAIAVDASGSVYVTGRSDGTWGSPVHAHAGSADAFVARLSDNGTLLWNTFLGSSDTDEGAGIAADGSGNVYVTGYSAATWGSPVNPHAGGYDAFVAKLADNGTLLWNTFMGSAGAMDMGYGIAAGGPDNVYVAGFSYDTWGSPVNAYTGSYDAFAAKLADNGTLRWNTFMGAAGTDVAYGIAAGPAGSVCVTGHSDSTWGSPVNSHAGGMDIFAARLADNGTLRWNTFMGSATSDYSSGIAADSSGIMYVSGFSYGAWGSPVHAYTGTGSADAVVAKVADNGTLLWNTFMGSEDSDYGQAVAADGSGNVYVTGYSQGTWGNPLNPYQGTQDAFVAKLGECIDADGDGYGAGPGCLGADCNDADNMTHPGAAELCNGKDDDCDGETDEGVTTAYYRDNDSDSYGDPAHSTAACAQPGGYVTDNTDCDDINSAVNPGATEVCNGIDDDCDGETDEGVTTAYYRDNDSDSYGDPAHSTAACAQPGGYVTDNTDCDDNNSAVNPDATEVCNGIDDDCDGEIDEGCASSTTTTSIPSAGCVDNDGDGYGDNCTLGPDCDDEDAFLWDICPDCTVKIFPKALGWFLGKKEKNRLVLVIGKRGTVYDENTAVRWETGVIEVVKKRVFFKRFMLLKVSIDGAALSKGEYRGLIGECLGALELVK